MGLPAADRERVCGVSDEPDLRRALAVSVVTHLVRLDQRQTLHADLVSCGDGGLPCS